METIAVERHEGVVTVTLDRPRRKNAAIPQMWEELLAALTAIGRSTADRCVVMTGAGGNFCSGADIESLASRAGDGEARHPLAMMGEVRDVLLALHHLPQPTIAKVRGVAVGIGMNLALACDLVAAAEDARFSEIFARRGLSVDGGGSWSLPRRVGMHRAKEIVLLADIVPAAEAERIGLVNRVVAGAEIDGFVDAWARRLAAGPPIALAQSKRLLDGAAAISLRQALDDEGAAQAVNLATRDTAEALAAWLEKREPRFEGR